MAFHAEKPAFLPSNGEESRLRAFTAAWRGCQQAFCRIHPRSPTSLIVCLRLRPLFKCKHQEAPLHCGQALSDRTDSSNLTASQSWWEEGPGERGLKGLPHMARR